MNILKGFIKTGIFFKVKFITNISAIMIAVYIIGIYTLSLVYKCDFNEVIIFNPKIVSGLNIAATFISSIVFFSGIFILFLIPGWIFLLHFENVNKDMPVFLGLSFILTLVILILATSLFKVIVPISLDREKFLALIISIVSIGLISLWWRCRKKQQICVHPKLYFSKLVPYIALILVAIVSIAIFHRRIIGDKLVKYDYRQDTVLSIPLGKQSDELEIFGLAETLKWSILPCWDLEYADSFGFVFTDPPLYPFINMFSVQFFGESKAAFVLPSIVFIVVIFLLIMAQGKENKYIRLLICSLLFLVFFHFSLQDNIAFIHKGYFLIFLIIISYEFLLRRNLAMFLLFATAIAITKYYGIFFIVLGFAGLSLFFKERRSELMPIMLKYIYILMGFAAFILTIGVVTGNTKVYFKAFLVEHFLRFDYFGVLSRIFPDAVVNDHPFNLKGNLQFLLWCLRGTAFTFPILFIFGKNKRENFYSFVALVYFVLVLFGRYHFMRYTIPLVALTAIVVSSKLERWILK